MVGFPGDVLGIPNQEFSRFVDEKVSEGSVDHWSSTWACSVVASRLVYPWCPTSVYYTADPLPVMKLVSEEIEIEHFSGQAIRPFPVRLLVTFCRLLKNRSLPGLDFNMAGSDELQSSDLCLLSSPVLHRTTQQKLVPSFYTSFQTFATHRRSSSRD